MKLALALGKTRRELLDSIDSEEMTLWMAFERVDPFGQERADYREALPWSVYFNSRRNPNSERCKPSDFMWQYSPEATEEQTPEQVEQAIDAAMSALQRLEPAWPPPEKSP